MHFYVGLHNVSHARFFYRCMISYNVLRNRRSPVLSDDWIMDSGAFTEVARNGGFRDGPELYVETVNRLAENGGMSAAVTQDWMCEPFVVEKTGLTVREHQKRTVDRYVHIASLANVYIMPVIQGYEPEEYAQCVEDYGEILTNGMWVGVGSVCKRSGKPEQITRVLRAIHAERPDLRLHGFGVQLRALKNSDVREELATADSMAWSFNARRQGRGTDANNWREALRYVEDVEAIR